MKYSTTLACAMAPLSLAAKVRNSYPIRRDGHLGGGEAPVPEVPVAEAPPPGSPHELALLQGMSGHGFTADAKTNIIIIWANPGGEGIETTTYNEKMVVTQTVTVAPDAAPTEIAGEDGATHTVNPGETGTVPAAGASHTVKVGGPSGNIFQPEELPEIPLGDTIIFQFYSKNHTVTQSAFDKPCEAMEGGMDSGFQANPDDSIAPPPQVAMQVMSADPLWFYCKQANHCGGGMVLSINPTAEKTHALFKSQAIEQNGDGEQSPITGGEPPAESPAGTTPGAPAATPPLGGDDGENGGENNGAVPGNGVVGEDGSCLCVVACSAGGWPAGESQGFGASGGMPGSIPLAMAALK